MNTTNVSSTVTWDEVDVGYQLPVHEREITAALIVGGAISATHDYAEVHHDYHAARKAGADNVFMNILTTNGLIGKYLTDWAGPTAKLKSITLRLAVPNYPGDVMTMSGKVSEKYEKDGEHLVEVEFGGKNSLGYHASGKAVVALERRKS
ncbi:MaoC like domain-containing protein [Mesobacillus persicus]|uniref:MaoC like domain-containing protein n=1 Tax=Mesobacillus persicus TaxID=930146 RepID=A0A1H8DB19_9BACI|nr:MaoC/PaaZ C-terminal domain-containing protein [Mesobacillus persicus]SEN04449.1 MaoC like domain-containing protein [Mesobacillus persicus]